MERDIGMGREGEREIEMERGWRGVDRERKGKR